MSAPIPISMPDELRESIRQTAEDLHLTQQDVIRRSIDAGLPVLRARFRPSRHQKLTLFDALRGGTGELKIAPSHDLLNKIGL